MRKDLDSLILTKNELEIMEVIWANNEATVRDVFTAISQNRKLSYSTISSEMRRLVKKGVLFNSEEGKAYHYKPLLSRQQATANYLNFLINKLFDGDPEKLLEFVMRNMLNLKDLLSIMYLKGRHDSKKRLKKH
jgi:predicted transcriptional regulator